MTVKKFIYDYLIKNWYWKLLSLVAACLFWYAYVNIQDPVTTEELTGIPVEVLHYDEFIAKGNNVEFEDTSLNVSNLTLDVTVRGRTSVLKDLTEQADRALHVWIDLYELEDNDNRLSIHYEFASAYSHTYNSVQFVNIYNQSYYAVAVDEDITKTLTLNYSIVGSPGEDYIYIEQDPNIMITPSEVTLTGSAAELEEIEEAQILVSVEGIKSNVALSEPIMYYDADGSRVYLSNTVDSSVDSATLYIPIYQTKSVPIEASIVGEVADGYEFQGDVHLSADSVVVYGQESDLKNIEKITLPDINISEYESNASEAFNIDDVLESLYPNGEVKYYSGSKTIRVSFSVSQVVEQDLELPTSMISIRNTAEGSKIEFPSQTFTVKVKGTADHLEALDPETITVTGNASDLKEGSQNLPLTVVIPIGSGVTLVDEAPQVSVNVISLKTGSESEETE